MKKKSLLQIVWKLPQQPSWSRELRLLQTEIIRLKNYFSSKILPSNNQVYEQRRNHETVLVGHVEETWKPIAHTGIAFKSRY